MSRLRRLLAVFAVVSLGWSGPVLAVAAATVEAVQSPAWRDRGGVTVPLAAGMELDGGDVLHTGPGARAWLMLAEGSRVKLGEGTRFRFHARSQRPQKYFRGALDVVAGAFRFTTGKLNQAQSREVAIRVGTTTIGIRGTDLWGRTNSDGDLVALLEGRIEISRAGQAAELVQPMTYFDAPHGQVGAIRALDPGVFSTLARQTEILPGDGAATTRGAWRVRAATVENEGAALRLYDRIREAGFAARIRPLPAEGGDWRYEVLLRGFSSAADAEVAAARLKAATGLTASVGR